MQSYQFLVEFALLLIGLLDFFSRQVPDLFMTVCLSKNSFNFSGQIWHQPEIKFYQNDKLKNIDGLGGKVISTINYEISKNKHLYGLTFHIGYKTNGYSLGERLSEGLILRSGLFFKLGNN